MDSKQAVDWLRDHAIPLWLEKGIDRSGGFIESLTLEGEPMPTVPRRAMVQARQIYSFRVALEMGLCPQAKAEAVIAGGTRYMLENFSLPSGGFKHSLENPVPELYTQAFALFGLANSFAVVKNPETQLRATALLNFLNTNRRVSSGGYTELLGTGTSPAYQSNPHMHLFEAALAWMEVDKDPCWKQLAVEMFKLCSTKFIVAPEGMLCEHFSSTWEPIREGSKFFFEPGHQYEWAWLLGRYQKLTDIDCKPVCEQLFNLSEQLGLDRKRRAAYDQVWSDRKPKLLSSRFWPQCERIKAAAQMGKAEPAREAMSTLFRYFELPVKGLWYDTWAASGQFVNQPVKASSLYHIIGAISEFAKMDLTPT